MGNLLGFCWPRHDYDWESMLKSQDQSAGSGEATGGQCSGCLVCCTAAPSGQYTLDNPRLNLSIREIKQLRKTWEDLKKIHDNRVACRLFSLIFSKCPEIKSAFNLSHLSNEEAVKDNSMLHHFLIFQDTLEMILLGLAVENDHMNSLLIAFGSQHSYYTRRKFDQSYWRVFGESFTELFDDLPAARYRKRRSKRLWVKIIFFILVSMRSGYQIGAAHKTMNSGSRRWWEEVRWKRKTNNLESKLLEVLFVTDPVEPN